MAATTYNLTIEQGIPYSIIFVVKNPDNSNKDLTGYTARMQLRNTYPSTTVALEATTLNTKLVISIPSSSVSIELSEADTKALTFSKYVYDLEIVSSTDIPIRLVEGTVLVKPEVTR